MVKQVKVTFEFDPETELVSNVICTVDGVEKKKKVASRKKKEEPEEMAAEALVTLEETKLLFNNKAVAEMELEYEDRIVIEWKQAGKILFPIIGTDIAFDKEGAGNKLTKSFTIAYKGKQNAVLAEKGKVFTLEPYEDGIWKLIPISKSGVTKVVEEKIIKEKPVEVTEIEPVLVSEEGDNEIEIDIEMFQL